MKEGTKVSWQIEGASGRGSGTTISEEKNGHVLVAVDHFDGETKNPGFHPVIHCATTWLTIEQPEAAQAAA